MAVTEVTDSKGRKLSLRELDPGDELDLFEACGKNSLNQAWLGTAMMVCSVASIDGTPEPFPRTSDAVKALARRLGHHGIAAIAGAQQTGDAPATNDLTKADVEVAKN